MNIFSDVFSNIVSEMGLWIKLYHYLCLSRYSINKGMKAKTREWLLAFLAGFLATVLGIVFTFGTSALLERRQRAADRRTSALMVMGSIESFARQLEESADNLARLDTVISWMLSVPVEQLDQVPPEMLSSTLLSLSFHTTHRRKTSFPAAWIPGGIWAVSSSSTTWALASETSIRWNQPGMNGRKAIRSSFSKPIVRCPPVHPTR